jgi:hypothetical protein
MNGTVDEQSREVTARLYDVDVTVCGAPDDSMDDVHAEFEELWELVWETYDERFDDGADNRAMQ